MKKANILTVLWIIFGFVFIRAIDSILYFISNLIYVAKLELNLSFEIMNISMPAITLILYTITTFLILNRIKLSTDFSKIYSYKFPKKLFLGLTITAITLYPVTNKLVGLYVENYVPLNDDFNFSGFVALYGWMTFGIAASRWLILIILTLYFIWKLDAIERSEASTLD